MPRIPFTAIFAFFGEPKKNISVFSAQKFCYSKWTYDVHSNNNPLVLDKIQYVEV